MPAWSLLLFLCLCVLGGCSKAPTPIETSEPPSAPSFGDRVLAGTVQHDPIQEASGLVASRKNARVLWTHNDSGDRQRLYALTTSGVHLGVYTLDGATARDWEDITLGPGPDPGQDYLYVGDIGDNEAQHDLKYVYRVPEPTVDADQAPLDTVLTGVARLTLQYPDGRFDAETLMIDPLTRDLYVITKRSVTVTVYRAPYPHDTTAVITMSPVTALTFAPVPNASAAGQGAVAGDIDPTGLEVLLKTYDKVYYWSRTAGTESFFTNAPALLPYVLEPQGEAIAWAADGRGYYTVSEEARAIPAHLAFYPRLTTSTHAP